MNNASGPSRKSKTCLKVQFERMLERLPKEGLQRLRGLNLAEQIAADSAPEVVKGALLNHLLANAARPWIKVPELGWVSAVKLGGGVFLGVLSSTEAPAAFKRMAQQACRNLRLLDGAETCVRVHGKDTTGQTQYVALELCDCNLLEWLQAEKFTHAILDRALHQCCQAVASFHAHVDASKDPPGGLFNIKFSNFLVKARTDDIRLNDLSMATQVHKHEDWVESAPYRSVEHSSNCMDGWQSPEQVQQAKEEKSQRVPSPPRFSGLCSDVFSLGKLLLMSLLPITGAEIMKERLKMVDKDLSKTFWNPTDYPKPALAELLHIPKYDVLACGDDQEKNAYLDSGRPSVRGVLAWNLVGCMLEKEPTLRPTMKAVLLHPFWWGIKGGRPPGLELVDVMEKKMQTWWSESISPVISHCAEKLFTLCSEGQPPVRSWSAPDAILTYFKDAAFKDKPNEQRFRTDMCSLITFLRHAHEHRSDGKYKQQIPTDKEVATRAYRDEHSGQLVKDGYGAMLEDGSTYLYRKYALTSYMMRRYPALALAMFSLLSKNDAGVSHCCQAAGQPEPNMTAPGQPELELRLSLEMFGRALLGKDWPCAAVGPVKPLVNTYKPGEAIVRTVFARDNMPMIMQEVVNSVQPTAGPSTAQTKHVAKVQPTAGTSTAATKNLSPWQGQSPGTPSPGTPSPGTPSPGTRPSSCPGSTAQPSLTQQFPLLTSRQISPAPQPGTGRSSGAQGQQAAASRQQGTQGQSSRPASGAGRPPLTQATAAHSSVATGNKKTEPAASPQPSSGQAKNSMATGSVSAWQSRQASSAPGTLPGRAAGVLQHRQQTPALQAPVQQATPGQTARPSSSAGQPPAADGFTEVKNKKKNGKGGRK